MIMRALMGVMMMKISLMSDIFGILALLFPFFGIFMPKVREFY
jgi:hypothetical protein